MQEEEKGKVMPFPDGNDGSGENQEKNVEDSTATEEKEKVVPDATMETCVLVAVDTKGRIGISTNCGIEMKREMNMAEVPGFLMEGAFTAHTMAMRDDLKILIKQTLVEIATGQPVQKTPAYLQKTNNGEAAPAVPAEE